MTARRGKDELGGIHLCNVPVARIGKSSRFHPAVSPAMTKPSSPFILHDGVWYLIPSFNRSSSARLLRRTLVALIERHPPEQILILRPMSSREERLLQRYRRNFDAEAFALMAPNEAKRLGRSK
jgi:hypothetical protein